jgi:hypothetical protein
VWVANKRDAATGDRAGRGIGRQSTGAAFGAPREEQAWDEPPPASSSISAEAPGRARALLRSPPLRA